MSVNDLHADFSPDSSPDSSPAFGSGFGPGFGTGFGTGPGAVPDLADPAFHAASDHEAMWRAARAVPVAWTESERVGGFWSVTTHAAANRVLKTASVFTSGRGMRLGADPAGVQAAAGRMLVVSDGEDHRRLRTVHQSWFTPSAMAAIAPVLQERMAARIAELADSGPFDAVTDFALTVPTWALFPMMAIPEADRDRLAETVAVAFDDADRAEQAAAHMEVFDYFDRLLQERREPRGLDPDEIDGLARSDMVTTLATACPRGRPLTDDEVLLNCDGLMNGGLETVPHAVAGALLIVGRQPEAWRRLREEPQLVDSAVEEVLRWTSPALHMMRIAAEDHVLGDAHIRRGDRVVVWLPSCNRDESVFADADRFVIDRRPNPHIAFGAGPHYCVGASLARLELACLLRTLIRDVESIDVVGEPVRRPSNFLRGLDRLAITVTPRRRRASV